MELSAIMLQLEMREKELLKCVRSRGPVLAALSVGQQDALLSCGGRVVLVWGRYSGHADIFVT